MHTFATLPARAVLPLTLVLALGGAGSSGCAAQERVLRTFGPEHGLEVPPVWALAQDSVGFIWVGAESGLFRFDGAEITRWAPDVIEQMVMDIAVSGDGRVAAMTAEGRILEVDGSRVSDLTLPWEPVDPPRRSGRVMAFDPDGALWVHVGDSIWAVDLEGGRSTVHLASELGDESPRGVVQAATGVLILTRGGVWRAVRGRRPERVYRTDEVAGEVPVWAVEPEPGRVLVLLNVGTTQVPRVVEILDGRAAEVATAEPLPQARAIMLRERSGTIWVAMDRYLAALRPGERPEILGPQEGFESGGALLVDRERSLWVGSFVGLHQYVEPDTRIWAERQGIPSRHTRFVGRSGSATWVMTWDGPAVLEHTEAGWSAAPTPWDSRSHICTAPEGATWTASEDSLMELRGVRARPRPGIRPPIHGCAPSPRGGAWLGMGDALAYVRSGPVGVVEVEMPRAREIRDPRPALLEDRDGRLWAGAGRSLCHAPAAELLAGGTGLWRCEDVATPSGVLGMVQLEDGRLWAALGSAGLLENTGEGWVPRPLQDAPTQTVHALEASPRGGVWIVGAGILRRVQVTADEGLHILEELTPWHGIPGEVAGDILEEPSGDLWLATDQGLARVPGSVRFANPLLPPVELVEARVDNRRIPTDGPLVLPHDQNRLELRFAALAFRHRAGLRHEVRLSAEDPWIEAPDGPLFRWVDLPAGTYHAEYRVSRDGERWATTGTGLTFRVQPPWYRTGWFLFLSGLAALGLAALLYRARVGYLLGLERQRTRIAMDLHDQVGSGLASVGILSGVLASDGLAHDERTGTAQEIAEVAEELGHSLSDIVWALDPQTASLEELSARLTEHGERLFPDDHVRFEARLPEHWPGVTPSMAVRRSVLLIGLEALHNAARHAGARRVTLRLEPRGRGWWELAVHDDGSGTIPPAGSRRNGRSGRGLASMTARAEAIGATLSVDSEPSRGTTVTLRFHPREGAMAGAGHRLGESLRSWGRMIMRRRSGT